MYVVRRGGSGGRWIQALRCPDAETAERVYARWVNLYPDNLVELTAGRQVARQRFAAPNVRPVAKSL